MTLASNLRTILEGERQRLADVKHERVRLERKLAEVIAEESEVLSNIAKIESILNNERMAE